MAGPCHGQRMLAARPRASRVLSPTRNPFMPDLLAAWTPRLIAIATADSQDDGAHDLNHLHRVWQVARALLASHPESDPLVVQAACYLHDFVNLPKNHPERAQASRMAAAQARGQPARAGFPAGKPAAVAHAIEAHSFSAGIAPTTTEARFVPDADRTDPRGPAERKGVV